MVWQNIVHVDCMAPNFPDRIAWCHCFAVLSWNNMMPGPSWLALCSRIGALWNTHCTQPLIATNLAERVRGECDAENNDADNYFAFFCAISVKSKFYNICFFVFVVSVILTHNLSFTLNHRANAITSQQQRKPARIITTTTTSKTWSDSWQKLKWT